MLMRTDPFRELDRLAQHLTSGGPGARPSAVPMDACRVGQEFVVSFDLPGVDPAAVEIDVERDVLTVKAERPSTVDGDVHVLVSERPTGVFSRRLVLGDALDTANITASYDAGVLTLRIPVAEEAKPRRIAVGTARPREEISA